MYCQNCVCIYMFIQIVIYRFLCIYKNIMSFICILGSGRGDSLVEIVFQKCEKSSSSSSASNFSPSPTQVYVYIYICMYIYIYMYM
jgi:hypothetical protein